MKKRNTCLAILAMTTMLFAACGTKPADTKPTETPKENEK